MTDLGIKQKTNLKSNMDRFIVWSFAEWSLSDGNLKSNMDRFIEKEFYYEKRYLVYLKSNMDRFIDRQSPAILILIVI